jgi:hypothetical protein
MFMIHERTNPRAFDRDKRRDCLQAFRNTANAWSSIEVQKPILPARCLRAPQRAPRRRDVNARAHAVAEHGNVGQPANQLRARNLASLVGQIITMKGRLRFSNALQEVRAHRGSRFHLAQARLYLPRTGRMLHITHQANPSTQATSETVDCQRRARAAILRPVRVSTTICRQWAQIGNDKVAPECNAAVRRETDCS